MRDTHDVINKDQCHLIALKSICLHRWSNPDVWIRFDRAGGKQLSCSNSRSRETMLKNKLTGIAKKQQQHHQQKFADIKCLALVSTSTTSSATSSYKMVHSILY
jgi:hypothetical protein